MPTEHLITLLSDFGLNDVYVGVMKGVIAQINPALTVVDLTHHIPPQNVTAAQFNLINAYPYFPDGTVHVVVVDPGVGGARRGIAARAGGHVFVGPDNGILAPTLRAAAPAQIHRIDSARSRTSRRGTTFDGRDVFAPAAARLAGGAEPGELGPPLTDIVDLAPFDPVRPADVADQRAASILVRPSA